MALELIKTPAGQPNAGIFNLPPNFDTKKYAAEWVEEGQVETKRQRQHLAQTNYTADGWEIWRAKKTDKPTSVRTSNSKIYYLMCRSRRVQDDVNAIFGNISKQQINREMQGQTIAGEAIKDQGMLSEDRLKEEIGREASVTDEDAFKLNPLHEEPAA